MTGGVIVARIASIFIIIDKHYGDNISVEGDSVNCL